MKWIVYLNCLAQSLAHCILVGVGRGVGAMLTFVVIIEVILMAVLIVTSLTGVRKT